MKATGEGRQQRKMKPVSNLAPAVHCFSTRDLIAAAAAGEEGDESKCSISRRPFNSPLGC